MAFTDTINSGLRRIPAWTIYIAGAVYVGAMFYLALIGRMGPEPINALEREYGETALILLVVGLLVTPLRRWFGINLMKFRRAIGVTAFFIVLAHFLVWAVLDVRELGRIWEEIVKRPYVTVGTLSFLLLIPLVVTSNNLAVRKLGAAGWRRLHKLTYPAAIFAALHYLWLAKGFQIEPILYLTGIAGLVGLRVWWNRGAKNAVTGKSGRESSRSRPDPA